MGGRLYIKFEAPNPKTRALRAFTRLKIANFCVFWSFWTQKIKNPKNKKGPFLDTVSGRLYIKFETPNSKTLALRAFTRLKIANFGVFLGSVVWCFNSQMSEVKHHTR